MTRDLSSGMQAEMDHSDTNSNSYPSSAIDNANEASDRVWPQAPLRPVPRSLRKTTHVDDWVKVKPKDLESSPAEIQTTVPEVERVTKEEDCTVKAVNVIAHPEKDYELENDRVDEPDAEEEFLTLMRESVVKRNQFETQYSHYSGRVSPVQVESESERHPEREDFERGEREREEDMTLNDGPVLVTRSEQEVTGLEEKRMKSNYYSAPEVRHIRPGPPKRRPTPFPGLIMDDEDEDEEDEGIAFPHSPPSSPQTLIPNPPATTTTTVAAISTPNMNHANQNTSTYKSSSNNESMTPSSSKPQTKTQIQTQTLRNALTLIRHQLNSFETKINENIFNQVQELYSPSASALSSAVSSAPSSPPGSPPSQPQYQPQPHLHPQSQNQIPGPNRGPAQAQAPAIELADLDSLPDFYLKSGPRETKKASSAILNTVILLAIMESGLKTLCDIEGADDVEGSGDSREKESLMEICIKRPARVERVVDAALRGIEEVAGERPGRKRGKRK